jgi:hypothetical protein
MAVTSADIARDDVPIPAKKTNKKIRERRGAYLISTPILLFRVCGLKRADDRSEALGTSLLISHERQHHEPHGSLRRVSQHEHDHTARPSD